MPPLPEDSVLYEAAQFVVPRRAYEALDVRAIVDQARRDGFARASVEANLRGAGAGKIRLTCRVAIAVRLMDAWTQKAKNIDPARDQPLIDDCRLACLFAFGAIDAARKAHQLGSLGGHRPATS
jgi:hypothetical protein